MFKVIYYLLASFLYILAIPYLLYKSRGTKYKKAIPAKFFLKDNPPFKNSGIWFHSCSMGETKALKPIFDKLNPKDINLSVITNTGYEQALSMVENVRYLPFEILLPFWMRKQKILLVMEAELWYMMFLLAKSKKTRTVLINARINDKSYKSYQKISFFYRYIFQNIDKVFAQSDLDKQRLESLGATNIEVIGNIKLASLPKTTKELKKPKGTIITAGSTHKGEEELILKAWDITQGKLILVPRHPERFDEVYSLLESIYKNSDITYSKYSLQNDFQSDIVLVDVMGELINIYAISDVVILGGGFIDSAGGHNPIEPAFFNTVVISGKTIFNQKSLFECVENYYLIENDELKKYLDDIPNLKKTKLGQKGSIEPIIKEIENYGKSI
ncbi:MAG: lipid IV(A) 3-deoxy-D-manno-octulosonic acid transferase [Campylobacterota bacterium]|nr:lipid IV(A) 3-deoxy-D-manno-octulosonic acid transferase [Campylobacterota bacterium]